MEPRQSSYFKLHELVQPVPCWGVDMQAATSNHTLVRDSKSRKFEYGLESRLRMSGKLHQSLQRRSFHRGLKRAIWDFRGLFWNQNVCIISSAISLTIEPRGCRGKGKEKRNHEVARKWEKSDSIASQLIWTYRIPAASSHCHCKRWVRVMVVFFSISCGNGMFQSISMLKMRWLSSFCCQKNNYDTL